MKRRVAPSGLTAVMPPAAGPAEGIAALWRNGVARAGTDAIVLCGANFTLDAARLEALCEALATADVAAVMARGELVAVAIRHADAGRLMLHRNRSSGRTALRELEVRLRQSRLRVSTIGIEESISFPPESSWERWGFAVRRIVERLGWIGFVTAAFSRSHRNAEVWQYRRSKPLEDPAVTCPLCDGGAGQQSQMNLRTSDDLRALGDYGAVFCANCSVARTAPAPRDAARAIAADVAAPTMRPWQRLLAARFIDERVARVRKLLPRDRRSSVADIGGGACAFANALAAQGCDVTVFEPNPANQAYADTKGGVRFVAAPFDDASVAGASLSDGSFDAVTMWHSLEHVPDPVATLALARRMLRPGGVLYASVPNLDSLQADFGENRWCYLDIPHHVTHFTPEGLIALLGRSGFAEPSVHWWSEEYELFGWYQTLLNRLTGSHNYFYNSAKKGKSADAGPYPGWTVAMTAAGPLLLPFVLVYSLWAFAASKPSCVEVHATVPR
jgi:SAM-dependent methyltransferase